LGGGTMNEGGGTMLIAGCWITDKVSVGGNNTDHTKDTRSGAGYVVVVCNFSMVSIHDSFISGDVAQGATMATGLGAIAYGVGIVTRSGIRLTVTNSAITENGVIAGFGGAIGRLHMATSAGFRAGLGSFQTWCSRSQTQK
jgi:hypothetical protein